MGNTCIGKAVEKTTSKEALNSCEEIHETLGKLVIQHGSLVDILGKPFKIFTKYVKVFDIYFVATRTSEDVKLLHGAYVLMQYIDNNGDGVPDNIDVYNQLVKNKATMVMFANEKEKEVNHDFFIDALNYVGFVQDLESDETIPGSIQPYTFDESLEECFHFLTYGYQKVYPKVFAAKAGTLIAKAMDKARGGHFQQVPKLYPSCAWFTYYNTDCDYSSQICEYMYWVNTSMLGAQRFRQEEIKQEWKLETRKKVEQVDKDAFALLSNNIYKFPTRLPFPESKH